MLIDEILLFDEVYLGSIVYFILFKRLLDKSSMSHIIAEGTEGMIS